MAQQKEKKIDPDFDGKNFEYHFATKKMKNQPKLVFKKEKMNTNFTSKSVNLI